MKLKSLLLFLLVTFVFSMASSAVAASGTIRIAFIDPLSGGFAAVGDSASKHFKFMADKIDAEGGVLGGKSFKIIPFDNKISSKESLVQLKHAIDQGIRFITQGGGSSVAGALTEAIRKHNRRNPDKTVLYLNYAAIAPTLTEENCNFWHFRFDTHVDMKMAAITDSIKMNRNIKTVFLINQNYSMGHAVSKAAKKMLKEKRPDIKIVGDTFHPILKVKDFSPYIAKIKKSGADVVITSNWGQDMALLGKSIKESGLKADFYTFFAGNLGTTSALGASVDGLRHVVEWHENLSMEENQPADRAFFDQYQKKFSDNGKAPWSYGRIRTMMEMLVKAINKAGSTDPKAVAYALEGMEHETMYGKVLMRAQDHQLLQPLYLARFTKAENGLLERENSGYGSVTEMRIDMKDSATPSPCKMKRP
ncbi:MAG: branched-chain amino acid ABC transporter substrate-binding protein [Deltaproteobacteria bacterium]|mgnify:FL=1|jgi:branched-chain amino acid transport system substrate-binding protein|nr:branched-chain amino acid ABC transporter substrate-binding protein [Deltaproteobacteria bacterium]MBT4643529.1 branched-chain amino acid ABC transporter substrate-binding protein [Deltaproteobacteria bacterium]MBT6500901.1 branched-chain amino acid ABC transporter substrate-binding protein [Deltaproteobacteria bacterium]MBT6616475.1 branched-chain amino acid ABC transporter substrate-binding protein [Deltaproteobacteria bacterium]MBT7154021.1 branched-chain amino acid ABC transporter substr